MNEQTREKLIEDARIERANPEPGAFSHPPPARPWMPTPCSQVDVIGTGDEYEVCERIEAWATCHVVVSKESADMGEGFDPDFWTEREISRSSMVVDVTDSAIPLLNDTLVAGNRRSDDACDFKIKRSRVWTEGGRLLAGYEVTT